MKLNRNRLQLRHMGCNISVLHRRFIWECFNGEIPHEKDVFVDNTISGSSFIGKLILFNSEEKKLHLIQQKQVQFNGLMPHPQCPNYVATKFGVVISLYTGRPLVTSPNGDGYIQLTMSKLEGKKVVKYQHVIVWEAWNSQVVPAGYQIDHIDQNKANNCILNLMCMTRKEHMAKTHSENPHIIERMLQGLRKNVFRICIHDGVCLQFDSMTAAADSIPHGDRHQIRYAIRNNSQYKGYRWEDARDPDLSGEYWKCMGTDDNNIEFRVSNLGRIWGKRGRKTFGSKRPLRYLLNYKNRTYGVHELVCMAFHGPPPSTLHTVDHIDRNPHNNRFENLKWATKKEQASNRKSVNFVEGFILDTSITIGSWPTINDAAYESKVQRSHITSVIKGRRKSCGKTVDGEKISWRHQN